MWLENYYHLQAHEVFGGKAGVNVTNVFGNVLTLGTNGSTHYSTDYNAYVDVFAPGFNNNTNDHNVSTGLYGARFVFGTGDTAVTYTDHALAAKWTQGISRIAVTKDGPAFDVHTGVYSCTLTATVQNTGSEAVTVREWGIECGTVDASALFLIYRDLLETPVTLNQFEAATFSVTMLYQMPNWVQPTGG